MDINQLLFSHPAYIDESTKETYIFTMGNLIAVLGISLAFAVLRGDAYLEPANVLVLLMVELLAGELIFVCNAKNEDME